MVIHLTVCLPLVPSFALYLSCSILPFSCQLLLVASSHCYACLFLVNHVCIFNWLYISRPFVLYYIILYYIATLLYFEHDSIIYGIMYAPYLKINIRTTFAVTERPHNLQNRFFSLILDGELRQERMPALYNITNWAARGTLNLQLKYMRQY